MWMVRLTVKWKVAPFNCEWLKSIFMSLGGVAIDSGRVGFSDFGMA
jgi:hypothetical protein